MELIDSRRQAAESTVGGESQAGSVVGPDAGSDGAHSELEGLQSMRELRAALAELEGTEMRDQREVPQASEAAPVHEMAASSREGLGQNQGAQEPWNQKEFQDIRRSSKDTWNMTLRDQGWIVR